jgi:hypothetical protein
MSIMVKNKILELESPFLKRHIRLEDGPHSEAVFIRDMTEKAWLPCHHGNKWGIPFECAVKINGEFLLCGIMEQNNVLWHSSRASYQAVDVMQDKGNFGDIFTIICRRTTSDVPDLELRIIYEISSELPLWRKQVEVINNSSETVTIENVTTELFYGVRVQRELQFLHDYNRDVMGANRHFIGFADFQFPEDLDIPLAPTESLKSFNLYAYVTPNEPVGKGIMTGRVLKKLCSHFVNPVTFQLTGLTPQPGVAGVDNFLPILDRCQSVGIEQIMFFVGQLFTNTGDYEFRRDIFPNGEKDFKRLLSEIEWRGMTAGLYCSYSIAHHGSKIREEHLEWECLDDQGRSFDPGAWGNMCFLSEWGDYIENKFKYLADDLGISELQIDGPTDIPCHAKNHKHSNQGNYQYYSWLYEKQLFETLREKNVTFTIPRGGNYLLMGASAIPGGYTEEDFCHGSGEQLLSNYRASMVAGRLKTPAWATWGFLAVGKYHGNSMVNCENGVELYEQAIASLLGYGNGRAISGIEPCYDSKTEAVLKRWIELFKSNRKLFNGDFIPLIYPTGYKADGVLLGSAELNEALAIFINPTSAPSSLNMSLPLSYIGATANSKWQLQEIWETEKTISVSDDIGNLELKTDIDARGVKVIKLKQL